jgi:nucleoid DNA-binding protein
VDSEKIVEQTFATIIDTLGKGEVVKISGFGNFDLIDKSEERQVEILAQVSLLLFLVEDV